MNRIESNRFELWGVNEIVVDRFTPSTLSFDAMTPSSKVYFFKLSAEDDVQNLMVAAYDANNAILKMMNKGVE